MKRLLVCLSATLLGLVACTHATPARPSPFSCTVRGHQVIVKLSGTHIHGARNPNYFGIGHGDDFIYLNYPPTHADFTPYDAHTRTLKLDLRSQQGIRYDDGAAVKVHVFTKPGRYQLLFADNLETEPDNTLSLQCTVQVPATNNVSGTTASD